MKTAVLLCTALACTMAKPNGYYHQEYNYQTSSSSYKNHELQHRNDDEGYYSKDGDLEGRYRPKVNAHSQHSEYVNPKLQHGYRMGTDRTSSYGQLNAMNRFGPGEPTFNHPEMGASFGYAGANENYGVNSNLRQVTTSLQQEMERELQRAVYDHHQRAVAYGGSISQSQIEADRRALEAELRRNVTMRLQEALKVQYGNQGVRGANSYSIINGRLQPTANYNNQELDDLTRQLEANLMRHLEQQVQSHYHTRIDTAVHTQRNTYQHDNGNVNYPGALQQRPPMYQPYPQPHPIPQQRPQPHPISVDNIPDSITTVATRVQTELNEHLNKLLEDTQRRYFTANNYQNHGNMNYENLLVQLQDQLRTNITLHFDDQIKRAYGYSNYATSKYSREDMENLRRQIETNLITKLNRDFNKQREKFFQTQRVYDAPRPIPANHVYYPTTVVQQSDIAALQRQMQEQLSRQLQEALMQQSYRQAHMFSSSASNSNAQANYQATLQQLTAELERNLTRQMEQLSAQQYHSGAYNSQLANMRHQLQNDLTRQLQQGLQQSYSRYSSWSSSSSSSSNGNYRPVRGYDPNLYRSYGTSTGGSAMGDDCLMGDDPSVYQQQDDGDEDLTQQVQAETLDDQDDLTQQVQDQDLQQIPTHDELTQQTEDDELTQQVQTDDDLTQQVQKQHDFDEPRAQYQQVQTSRRGDSSVPFSTYPQPVPMDGLGFVRKPEPVYVPSSKPSDTEQVSIGKPGRLDLPPEQKYQAVQTADDIERPFEAQSVSHLYSKPAARPVQTISEVPNAYLRPVPIRRDPLYDQSQQAQTFDIPRQQRVQTVDQTNSYIQRNPTPVGRYRTYETPSQYTSTYDWKPQRQYPESSRVSQTVRYYETLEQQRARNNQVIYSHNRGRPLTQQTQQVGQQTAFGQTQQTQDLLGQQTVQDEFGNLQQSQNALGQQIDDSDLTQQTQDAGFGKLQVGDQTQQSSHLTQQNQLPRRTAHYRPYSSISRRPISPQTQQSPQIGQQSDNFGQTQQTQDLLGQQTEQDEFGQLQQSQNLLGQHVDDSDLTQQTQDAGFGKLQIGDQKQHTQLGQQVEDLAQQNQYNDFGPSQQTQQSRNLGQQTDDEFAPLQIGGHPRTQQTQSSNYRWVTPTRKPLRPASSVTQHRQDEVTQLTQQQAQVLTDQQSESLTQQTEDLTQQEQTQDLTQQTQDLTQQTQDLTQQTEDLTQQSQDLTQQSQDLTQQSEDFTEQNQYLSHQSQDLNQKPHDLTQQSEDLTQQSQDLTQQTEDLTQQSQDLTQQNEDFTVQNPYLNQQSHDLTHQTQDLTQQNQDLTQQSEDLTQQSEDLTQQSQDLTQQNEDFTEQNPYLSQQSHDLTHHTQDLTQQSEDLTQQNQDLTQQSEDLTQQVQDLTQQSEDIDQPIEPQVASNKIFKDEPSYQQLAKQTDDLIQQEINQNQPPSVPTQQIDEDRLTEAERESQRLIELIRAQSRQNKQNQEQQQQNHDIGPMDYSPKPVYADYNGHPVQVGTTRQLQIPEQNTYSHHEPLQPLQYNPRPVYDENGHQVGTTRQLPNGRSLVSQHPSQVKYGRPQQEEVNVEGVTDIKPLVPQVAHEVQEVGAPIDVDTEVVEPTVVNPAEDEMTTKQPGFWSRLGSKIKNKIG